MLFLVCQVGSITLALEGEEPLVIDNSEEGSIGYEDFHKSLLERFACATPFIHVRVEQAFLTFAANSFDPYSCR